jgi:hypothetical protein
MNFNFNSQKVLNSDRVILINGDFSINSLCYNHYNGELLLVRNEDILLENNFIIKTNNDGKIYEIKENVKIESKKTIEKYTPDEFWQNIEPLIKEIENRIKSMSPINGFEEKPRETTMIETTQKNTPSENLNVLISAICFVNRKKPGAEIYATFANRLLNDVMTKTPYDFRIVTNEAFHFQENKDFWGDRVIVTEDKLENEKITVGPFNQLLKYKTMIGVDKKYNWLMYLDCDAGFTENLDVNLLEKQTKIWLDNGYDFIAPRTNAILKYELSDHESKKQIFEQSNPGVSYSPTAHGGNLFSAKFIFYNVSSEHGPHEWMEAKLPSEHIWYIKNDERLEKCGTQFKKFNEKFESQSPDNIITADMEAFEVGVSALLAGYNMGELGGEHFSVMKVGFNFNNWEKVKY